MTVNDVLKRRFLCIRDLFNSMQNICKYVYYTTVHSGAQVFKSPPLFLKQKIRRKRSPLHGKMHVLFTSKRTLIHITLFFQDTDSLLQLQTKKWGEVLGWYCQRYAVSIKPSTNMSETPHISNADREKIRRQLLSYNFEAIAGFSFGVDALKSIILMSAVIEYKLSVEQAVQLARLETEFQVMIRLKRTVSYCLSLCLHSHLYLIRCSF